MLKNQSVRIAELAALQYAGIPGISSSCYRAIERLVQAGERITQARLVSSHNRHAFLLEIEIEELIVIQSGFSSGYPGEGPRTLAEALNLLETINVPIEEVEVSIELFVRLEAAALTRADVDLIRQSEVIRPWRLPDYLHDWPHLHSTSDNAALKKMPLVIPWPLIDKRLDDLAFKFLEQPDDCLLKGYRRLEDIVRRRTTLDEHGVKLLSKAFAGTESKLTWVGIDQGEQAGRAQLFSGAYMAVRNPLAHHEHKQDLNERLIQFIQLNQLFTLERVAVLRPPEEESSRSRIDGPLL